MEENIDPPLKGGTGPPAEPPSRPKKEYHPHIIDLESETEDSYDSGTESVSSLAVDSTNQESVLDSASESDTESDSEPDSDYDSDVEYSNENLASTITREIQNGEYTCLVCTSEIDHFSKVWSCHHCYRVYDLDCIKDWALRGSSTDKVLKTWRCPSCNNAHTKIPSRFTCWCGRVSNPNSSSLIPFSCGNMCTYKHKSCIHTCSSVCHPGTHPICGAMGPLLKCNCGKEERQLPCLITPYEAGWKCEAPCAVKVCELHTCKKGCHLGFCGLCDEDITIKCYCGGEDLAIKCSDKVLKLCEKDGEKWVGGGRCSKRTTAYYECGIHFEELSCQPPTTLSQCKLAPSQITTCYCGKTEVGAIGRTKCTDPVPECDLVCGKLLPCGCTCLLKCHEGECVCYEIKDITCSCGHEAFSVPCKYIQQGYQPKCKHKCSALLNCRKHYHREICCPSEQAAIIREREKKKAIRNNTRSNFQDEIMSMEAVHICTRTCNRLKSCGQHYCEALCHPGPCGVCLESSNDDLICNCGKTIIQAPVRCGTKLVCTEQCIRPKSCGHPPEHHKCHEDDVQCPKCTTLVKKECNCGLKEIPGVLCSQQNISCGTFCKVKKSCGHACLRACSGKCTKENIHESSTLCRTECNKARKSCPHICKLKCHFNKPGRKPDCDVNLCAEMISIKCECGRITTKVPCGASNEEPSKLGTILECDFECAKLVREKELRSAFNLKDIEVNDQDNPYSDVVMTIFEKQPVWCSRIENLMRAFVEDYELQIENGLRAPKRTHHFPAMTHGQRTFVHELAANYKLYSESQDKEPNRTVFIVITRLTALPEVNISEAINRRTRLIREANAAAEMKEQTIRESFFNALVIQDVFFGIIKDELEAALLSFVDTTKIKEPAFQWMKELTFVFYSKVNYKQITEEEENDLYLLMKVFKRIVREKSLAFDCRLCFIDDDVSYILKVDDKASKSPEPKPADKVSTNAFDVLETEPTD